MDPCIGADTRNQPRVRHFGLSPNSELCMDPLRIKGQYIPFPLSERLVGATKADFEMVVARYDENIQWSDAYMAFRTVYNKGAAMPDTIPLENKGHLADTILRHIITRYDSLAACTFFCHGGINYREDQKISFAEFLKFVSTNPTHLKYLKPLEGGHLPETSDRFNGYYQTAKEVFKHLYGEAYRPDFPWAAGKWISVGRDRILQRPLAFYEKMLAWILAPHEGQEPSQAIYRTRGIYIERFILKAWL